MPQKRLAVIVSARPSWAKLLPVCDALRDTGAFQIDLIACAYALTHTRSGVVDMMRQDDWTPTTELHAALDANTLESSALTTGLLTVRLSGHFAATQPDGVIVCADRHETLAASIAAAYSNVPICHLQGGEHSGNIDQKVRWANTSLADWHCVSNDAAYAAVVSAGVPVDRVAITGCPSIDVARLAQGDDPVTADELSRHGTGGDVDPEQPFALVMQHAVTTHPDTAREDLWEAIALGFTEVDQVIAFWPGADAGADDAALSLRAFGPHPKLRLLRSLPPRRFLKLLSQTSHGIGNSSALIREGSYYGIRRTILGDRQSGRAWSEGPSTMYGDGFAAPRIARVCQEMVNS